MVSDAEFIRLASESLSVVELSQKLGISERNTHARGKRLQAKFNRRVLPNAYLRTSKVEHATGIYQLEVQDGTVLVGSDAHIWPGEWTTMQRAFIAFARKLHPVAVVANGDFFDGAKVSRWPSIGWEHRPEVAEEIEAVQDYLGSLQVAAGKAKRIWTLGNHDARFETRLAATSPEYRKLHGMHLKDYFPAWEPAWRVDINDDVVVRHRELGGEHADYRNVQTAGKTMVTGHDHRTGVTPWRNYAGLKWGVRCGFMADHPTDPQFVNYLEARVTNWHPAFVVLTFRDGRLLWPELVTKHADGVVEFRGELVSV